MDRVLRTSVHRRVPRPAAVVRVVAGLLFVVFALPKFTDHARWVSDLGTYGLPSSSLLVYAIGTVELLGGLALLVGVLPWAAGAGLAMVMVGAVVTGGLVGGNPTSLTLAPALLLAAAFVAWSAWPRSTREPALR